MTTESFTLREIAAALDGAGVISGADAAKIYDRLRMLRDRGVIPVPGARQQGATQHYEGPAALMAAWAVTASFGGASWGQIGLVQTGIYQPGYRNLVAPIMHRVLSGDSVFIRLDIGAVDGLLDSRALIGDAQEISLDSTSPTRSITQISVWPLAPLACALFGA